MRDTCEQKTLARKRRQLGDAGRWEKSKGVQECPTHRSRGLHLERHRGSDPGRGTKRERQERTDDQKELCMLRPVNSCKT